MTPPDSTVYSSRKIKNFSKPTAKICESYGCNNKSMTSIVVDVGRLGNIDLNVCKRCIPKFSNSNKNNLVDELKQQVKLLEPAQRQTITAGEVYDSRNIRRG
jgi:hypothetical protein